jgi:nucleolar protein 56
VTRPLWSDKGNDVQAVADHLDQLAATATTLRFAPVPLPSGADLAVLHQAALLRVRKQLSQSHAEADRILSQEVRAIDDLVRTANLLVERLREWYALHAPEATRMVTDAETLAKLVAEKGDRTAVMQALDQAKVAESSLGSDLDPADLAVLRGFAAALAAVHSSWHALEARVMQAMEDVAPNLASVTGPVIGARLIALSGGLNRLATWPAGTVQLLGAETALFRHIKEGTKPPKHGILFQHPSVHLAPPWQRGPIARILALAAAKAAKADAFTKNDLKAYLADEVKTGVERIQRERPRPPQRKSFAPTRGYGGPRRGPPARGGAPQRAPAPRFGEGAPRDGPRPGGYGGGGGGYNRGPPRDGGFNRGPPRPAGPSYDRAPPARDGFGGGGSSPPARRFDDRAPPASREGGFAPREDGAGGSGGFNRGPPRDDRGGGFNRGPPRDGGAGGFNRGPPRDDRGGGFRDGPRDGPRGGFGGQGGGSGAGWKPKRKPQGAFRGDGGPAAPPGKAKPKEDDQ